MARARGLASSLPEGETRAEPASYAQFREDFFAQEAAAVCVSPSGKGMTAEWLPNRDTRFRKKGELEMNAQNDRPAGEFLKITRREMQEAVGGAGDYLLELDGIKGESTQAGTHAGGGGGGAGKVSMRDFSFTMKVCKV
jgi:hypothetical protein